MWEATPVRMVRRTVVDWSNGGVFGDGANVAMYRE